MTLLLLPDWKYGGEKKIPDRGQVQAIHEVTRMIIADMNPSGLRKLGLNEGITWYLSLGRDSAAIRRMNRARMGDDLLRGAVPGVSAIASSDPKNWTLRKGDLYGREFVRFVTEQFAEDKVPALARNVDDLSLALGKPETDLYPEWLKYLDARYSVSGISSSGV